ncbi:CheR family methyltransferase [Algirhabdus cladophorae]|uniref:CheR family methyltransferase n=1 Tax=Algirhabdus cladophorae TaxID=3377108 RepID=UPI003B8486BF
MPEPATTATSEFSFSDGAFDQLAAIAHKRFGLSLPKSKKTLVYSRLSKRVRTLGLDSLDRYVYQLCDRINPQEDTVLASLLTTNVTHFFREAHHFQHLRDHCIPRLIEKAANGERVRLWSAGCSSGQEAFCIGMLLIDACPEIERYDIRVLGTDIDPKMVKTASSGMYPCELVKTKKGFSVEPHFELDARQQTYSASRKLRKIVSFAELNLIEPWPFSGTFDAIFCRNVAIYFDTQTQAELWNRFAASLLQNGMLYLGHSERLDDNALQKFRPVGVTTYERL